MGLFQQLPTVLVVFNKDSWQLFIHINDLEDSIPEDLVVDTTKYADDCTEDQLVEQSMSSSIQVAIDRATRLFCKWAETSKMN